MKRMNIFRMLAILMLTLPVACVDEIVPASTERQEPAVASCDSMTIYATLEQGLTKTTLGANLDVVWNEGDQIRVYNDRVPNGLVYTLEPSSAGSVKGAFSGTSLPGGGPYYAVYPASVAGSLSGESISIQFPSVQSGATGGSFAPASNISIGKASSKDEIYFQNVCGLLSVTLQGTQSIRSIRVESSDEEECLSGQGVVTPSLTEGPSVSQWSGTNSLTLNLKDGETLTPEGKTYYLVVPTGTLTAGFSVSVQDADGGVMVRHAAGNSVNMIVRSTIRPMPSLSFAPEVANAWLTYDAGADEGAAGAFNEVGPGSSYVSLLSWTEIAGQYAWYRPDGGPCSLRIQNWDAGYVLAITLESPEMSVGRTYLATIETLGNAEDVISAGTRNLKVVKKENARIWLTDGNKGYIMKMEED